MTNTASSLTLRIRTNTGVHPLPLLLASQNVLDLKKNISDLTGYPVDSFNIMKGYPPKLLDYIDDSQRLSELILSSGDLLLVQQQLTNNQSKLSEPNADIKDVMKSNLQNANTAEVQQQGILMKRVVPADNSCLFTSINFLLNNGKMDLSPALVAKYRTIVSNAVLLFENPDDKIFKPKSGSSLLFENTPYDLEDFLYLKDLLTPAILGKPNSEYARWILSHQSWGGAVEIALLSRHFRVEITVVDIRNCRLERFGQEAGYTERILLLYDGIHYDPLVMECQTFRLPEQAPNNLLNIHDKEPITIVKTKFPTTPQYEFVLDQALEIADQAKNARQFTSVSNFTLKCYDCNALLVGETQASSHAQATGHLRFGEIDKKT
ncbi:unnamed protein product [Gordionus sp. m RMFG-2023]|uniref:ubiquitin thioesterase OTU1-like n=1 Tax=Gordionus sp. m RMFG-2023 TaxID=3053472 RepID=UPI0030E32C70